MSKILERLDELEKAATPGPWTVYHRYVGCNETPSIAVLEEARQCGLGSYVKESPAPDRGVMDAIDTQFVAELRNAYPKLRAVVEAAREVVRDPYLDEIEHLAGTLKALDTSSANQDKG